MLKGTWKASALAVAASMSALCMGGCASEEGAGGADDLTQAAPKLTFVIATDCEGTLPDESPYRLAVSPAYVFTIQEDALSDLGLSYKTGRIRVTRIANGKRYNLGSFAPTDTLKVSVSPQDWKKSSIELDFQELATSSTKASQKSLAGLYKLGVFKGNWLSSEWSMPFHCAKE